MATQKSNKSRVCAYARVSTNKNDQANSLENQKTYFLRELERNPEYTLVNINIEDKCDHGIYYDKGTSGTKLSRPAFDQLLTDAGLAPIIDADNDRRTTTYKIVKKPKFDRIYVKDASRFSRNVNANAILQTLRENKVYVNFLDLGMSTESEEDISMIQIFLTFAERESRDRSKKVSFGYQEGARQGKLYFGGKMIGFDYDKETNSLVVNETEAELVRLVYDMYVNQGLGQQRICNRLDELGYKNSNGKPYGRSTIARMLQNSKYAGISNVGRYHKEDLLSSKKFVRESDHELRQAAREAQQKQIEQGIVKIPAIISVELFESAQEITRRNSEIYKVDHSWHGTTDYAKKVVCGCCGAYYIASGRRYYVTEGKRLSRYTCRHTFNYDPDNGIPKCKNPAIRESRLDEALNSIDFYTKRLDSIEELLVRGDFYIEVLTSHLDKDNAVAVDKINKEIDSIKTARAKIIKLYAEGTYSKEELDSLNADYTEQISALSAKAEMLSSGNAEINKRISTIKQVLKEAKTQYKEVKDIVESKKYPEFNRVAMLREVDRIVIDIDGQPNIIYKGIDEINEFIRGYDALIDSYIDASNTDTKPSKSFSELVAEFEKNSEK